MTSVAPEENVIGGLALSVVTVFRLGLGMMLTGVGVYYALISADALPDHRLLHGYNDLVLHAGLFALLGLVVLARSDDLALRITVLLLLAGSLELGQLVVEGREPSWNDFFASVAGIVIALMALFLVRWLGGLIRPAFRPGKTR